MVLAPYVVDVGFGALVLHHNPDVALQLALIDFEVLTLAGMTQLLGHASPAACGPPSTTRGVRRRAAARATTSAAS